MSLWRLSKLKFIISVVISAILVAASLWVIANRQFVLDQITVWQFHSTSELDGLIARAGMNDKGMFYFHASQPVLDGTQTFNVECDRIENTTSILGCYTSQRIYIYDVIDPQLDGVREVTAAHETLHAAYQRLDSAEKAIVNTLLEVEYAKLDDNPDFNERMAFYERTEPGERDNELHSVIGTEVANISLELETYYKKYFTDRQKVVDLNTKYMSVFINLKNQANDLAAQMDTLTKSITDRTNQYNDDVIDLNGDIAVFNRKAANGGFASQAQFNSERAALSVRVNQLAATRSSIDSDIEKYNALLSEYNSLASESKKLYNTIDSTLAPAPSV